LRDCITPRLERLGPAYASHCGTEFDSALKGGGIEEPTLPYPVGATPPWNVGLKLGQA
jgi:hypothetical protein